MHFALLICVAIVPFATSNTIHMHMTPDEVMGVFRTTHDAVPDYEVVKVIHTRAKRDTPQATKVQISTSDDEVKLYLHPTEGYLASTETPLWTTRSNPSEQEGIEYTLIPGALKSIGTPLQDRKAKAAVLATPQEDGRIILDGVISQDKVIRSLPERVVREVMYGEDGLYEPHYTKNATDDGDMVYTYHHVVYKQKKPEGNQYEDIYFSDIPKDEDSPVPEVIFPEILVVVDYDEYVSMGRDIEQAKRYIVSFWNAIDLRYRTLTNPKIRLNIAGIVIAMDADATPYIENNRIEMVMVDADRALRGMGDYFYRETRIPHDFYDIAMLMTPLDLCNIMYGDYCDPGTLGYAYVAGACNRNATKQSSEAVGLVEDNGGFSGIIPATHELGHLIGARHDGNPKHASDCGAYDGFIMTGGLLLEENGFEWSNCSINAFHTFLNEERAQCLYDELRPATPIRRFLPGKLKSVDRQCQKVTGTKACNKNTSEICIRLKCEVPGAGGYCRAIAPAAEGSSCGKNLICLNGKCILEGTVTKNQDKHKMLKFFKRQRIRPIVKKIAKKWLDRIRKKVRSGFKRIIS